ncbi:hypothetical protein IEQ34_002317 [Dendrobium chrysotoxum]|uniref:Uncharacterized protein n=1 Tax=Dendrobium chrysotoxum TaxID=161865 RepID=A0AAV7HP84_DENCH|nr:hypothetical protein IEQ34_002317 [Dendrobium chrysotoxum]
MRSNTDPQPNSQLMFQFVRILCTPIRSCLVDEQGNPIKRRGHTTYADMQNMPSRTRIHIEVNENNIPSNIPESILLGSYLGVVARYPVLALIAFPDWSNKGMEPFKKKMLAEVEEKAAKNFANAKKQTYSHTMGRIVLDDVNIILDNQVKTKTLIRSVWLSRSS